MIKRLVALSAVLLFLIPGVSATQAASGSRPQHVQGPANGLAGTLTNMTGSVLTFVSGSTTYTVTTSSATRIVRLYNAPSGLDEMSPGDLLLVRGPLTATNTIAATFIKDQSIQRAWTHMSGTLQSVTGSTNPATATVTVVRDFLNAPFSLGQSVSLDISAATKIISPTASGVSVLTGTAGLSALSASQGTTVTVMGVYDRVKGAYTTVDRVRLHQTMVKPTANSIAGTIVNVSGLTTPATVTVQTIDRGLVTVNIASSSVHIVRRFDGASGLDELSPGDHVAVQGSFAGATTFNASGFKDLSIQEWATRAVLRITALGSNSFTGVVLADSVARARPFDEGATLTVTVSTSGSTVTKIWKPMSPVGITQGQFSDLAVGQTVTAMGVYNRHAHTYIATTFVRIHR